MYLFRGRVESLQSFKFQCLFPESSRGCKVSTVLNYIQVNLLGICTNQMPECAFRWPLQFFPHRAGSGRTLQYLLLAQKPDTVWWCCRRWWPVPRCRTAHLADPGSGRTPLPRWYTWCPHYTHSCRCTCCRSGLECSRFWSPRPRNIQTARQREKCKRLLITDFATFRLCTVTCKYIFTPDLRQNKIIGYMTSSIDNLFHLHHSVQPSVYSDES